MTIQQAVQGEIDELAKARDELKLKLHLGKAEVQERWMTLENKWLDLEGKMKFLGEASAGSARGVMDAVKLLVGEIRDGYQRIRQAI